MKKKVLIFFLLASSLLLSGTKQSNATETNENDKATISTFAGMKPSTVYIGSQNVYFTGSSAPATIYYQAARYGASYRGYLTRNYSSPIIWGTGSNYTNYYGTLYRSDLPLPIPASIKIPELGETSIPSNYRSTSKLINYTVTIRKGAYIPDYYWYDNGQFRGNLKLIGWEDYSEHPKIKGYICTYRGSVYNGPAPATRSIKFQE